MISEFNPSSKSDTNSPTTETLVCSQVTVYSRSLKTEAAQQERLSDLAQPKPAELEDPSEQGTTASSLE